VKSKTPIVPVTINNSGRLFLGVIGGRSGTISAAVGAPISMQDYRPGSLRADRQGEQVIAHNLRPVDSISRQADGPQRSRQLNLENARFENMEPIKIIPWP
jgi:hypothetical protein